MAEWNCWRFRNLRREFEYGCKPTACDMYDGTYLGLLESRRAQAFIDLKINPQLNNSLLFIY